MLWGNPVIFTNCKETYLGTLYIQHSTLLGQFFVQKTKNKFDEQFGECSFSLHQNKIIHECCMYNVTT